MNFRDDIAAAARGTIGCADNVHGINILIILVCVCAAPFTVFTSLFGLLAIPFNSCAAAIANNTYRQKELTKVHLMMLADLHRVPDSTDTWE